MRYFDVFVFFADPVLIKSGAYYCFLAQNLSGIDSACKIAFFRDHELFTYSSLGGPLTFLVFNSVNLYELIELDTQELLPSLVVVDVKEIESVKSLQKRLDETLPQKIFMLVDEAVGSDTREEMDDNGSFDNKNYHFDSGEFYCERVRGAGVLFD